MIRNEEFVTYQLSVYALFQDLTGMPSFFFVVVGRNNNNYCVFFLHREINKGFCCKFVNIIACFCLETIYLLAVGTKILHLDAKGTGGESSGIIYFT